MAVVFISPKQRQRTFFIGITVMFLLFLAVIFFGVFLSAPTGTSPVLVFNKPKVSIDMSIFNSDQFKNLQPFAKMQTQYSYTATLKSAVGQAKQETGFITADSIDQAKTILQGMGLEVSQIKEAEIGRDNPFTPYYQAVASPAAAAKTATKK